jgi:hypothetical protein
VPAPLNNIGYSGFSISEGGIFRANIHTVAASDTPVREKSHLGSNIHAFRICAPPAGEGTSFEEYQCAYAGSVVNTEPFNIEYQAFQFRLFPWNFL